MSRQSDFVSGPPEASGEGSCSGLPVHSGARYCRMPVIFTGLVLPVHPASPWIWRVGIEEVKPSHYTAMLHLRPYMISEDRTLSQSIVPQNHAAFMYVHVHSIALLPNCVYVHTHLVKPGGDLNPSHYTLMLCLRPYTLSNARRWF